MHLFLKKKKNPPKWCTSSGGATWNCRRIGASSAYTIQPCTMSLHAKPHTQGVCKFSCNLPPALLAEWPGSFTCYCGNMGVEWIRVSTESRPWRRKFSCHSCRDSNPRPFNRESSTLTTEPSPPPGESSYTKENQTTRWVTRYWEKTSWPTTTKINQWRHSSILFSSDEDIQASDFLERILFSGTQHGMIKSLCYPHSQ